MAEAADSHSPEEAEKRLRDIRRRSAVLINEAELMEGVTRLRRNSEVIEAARRLGWIEARYDMLRHRGRESDDR